MLQNYLNYAKHVDGDQFVLAWVEKTLGNHLKKATATTEEVEHIIDYLVQTDKKISQMSYVEAKSNAEKWTKTLQKKGEHIKETAKDVKVVLDFKDGFKIVKLVGENAFKREGFLMCHCAGSYHGKGKEVYSLRDKDNMPHATMEKDQQIKGKGNGDICPRYVDYVVKFLEHIGMTVSDSEMAHLGYVNVEEAIKKEPDLVFPNLYRGKYFYKENLEKVENRDRLSLWNIFGLFTFDVDLKVKFNFNIEQTIVNFREKLSKIKRNKKDYSKIAGGDSSKIAGGNSSEIAGGNSSEIAGGDYSKIAGGDSSEIAGGNSSEIAGGNSSEIAGGNSSKIAAEKFCCIASGIKSTIETDRGSMAVSGNESKVKGKIGSWFVLYERDNNGDITHAVTIKIDGKEFKKDTFYHLVKGIVAEYKQSEAT